MATCPDCSAFVPDGSKYCPLCGTPVGGGLTRAVPMTPSGRRRDPGPAPLGIAGARRNLRPRHRQTSIPPARCSPAATASSGCWARAGWARSIAQTTSRSGSRLRSSSCRGSSSTTRGRLAQLLDEVRAARTVSHPAVCRVYDVGQAEGRHFLSMEFIDGEDLASSLRRIGRFPMDKGLEIARQLCAGLAAVHEKGLLHRDLKPANVMLDGRGKVRLTDFGLAGEVESGMGGGEVAGTPAYMAPEQLAGGPATVQSDIYALGLVLYEVFTGRRAFEATTIAALRGKQERETPAPMSDSSAGIDPAIEEVILRCLAPVSVAPALVGDRRGGAAARRRSARGRARGRRDAVAGDGGRGRRASRAVAESRAGVPRRDRRAAGRRTRVRERVRVLALGAAPVHAGCAREQGAGHRPPVRLHRRAQRRGARIRVEPGVHPVGDAEQPHAGALRRDAARARGRRAVLVPHEPEADHGAELLRRRPGDRPRLRGRSAVPARAGDARVAHVERPPDALRAGPARTGAAGVRAAAAGGLAAGLRSGRTGPGAVLDDGTDRGRRWRGATRASPGRARSPAGPASFASKPPHGAESRSPSASSRRGRRRSGRSPRSAPRTP